MQSPDWRDFYSGEAQRYEDSRYASRYGRLFRELHRATLRGLLAAQAPRPCERALDVATGTGQVLPVLLEHARQVVASDLTGAMLRVAGGQASSAAHLSLTIADAFRLPFPDESFDLVTSSRFLHLFPAARQQSLVAEMGRVLRPGGTLVVDFYNATPRRVLAPLIWLYRRVLRRRPENDFRLETGAAQQLVTATGLTVHGVFGVGSYFLAPLLWLPRRLVWAAAGLFRERGRRLSEQFVVVARKY